MARVSRRWPGQLKRWVAFDPPRYELGQTSTSCLDRANLACGFCGTASGYACVRSCIGNNSLRYVIGAPGVYCTRSSDDNCYFLRGLILGNGESKALWKVAWSLVANPCLGVYYLRPS